MNFLDIRTLAKNRIDELDLDPQIDVIVDNAINYAYQFIATRVEKKTKTTKLAFGKIIDLPTDFFSLVYISNNNRELRQDEYELKGDKLIIKSIDVTGDIDITYVYFPELLKLDTDLFEIKDMYAIATATYAHYSYMMYRKNPQVAQMLYNEFLSILQLPGQLIEGDNNELERN